jgi:hypothetical protein
VRGEHGLVVLLLMLLDHDEREQFLGSLQLVEDPAADVGEEPPRLRGREQRQ